MPAPAAPPPLKEWFNEERHRTIARQLAGLTPAFATHHFLQSVLHGLEERSLMQRLEQCARAAGEALPGTYRQKVRLLQKLAPVLQHEFVAIFPCAFVASQGLDDFDFSLDALKFFTVFGSAEFAVRPFLLADQPRALKALHQWTSHPSDKVRRLASEGSRPRLPWGSHLPALIKNPEPTAPILEALKNDPSRFVRRSVANHLNDISKDHPDLVIQRLKTWNLHLDPQLQIAKHACRTLIKKGHPEALALFGFKTTTQITASLETSPPTLPLGGRLTLHTTLTSTSSRPQTLAVDYLIHYVKANGTTSAKVFKWTEINLPPHTTITLAKSQLIRDFTTRRHHPGQHRVELQINGSRVATHSFLLSR